MLPASITFPKFFFHQILNSLLLHIIREVANENPLTVFFTPAPTFAPLELGWNLFLFPREGPAFSFGKYFSFTGASSFFGALSALFLLTFWIFKNQLLHQLKNNRASYYNEIINQKIKLLPPSFITIITSNKLYYNLMRFENISILPIRQQQLSDSNLFFISV